MTTALEREVLRIVDESGIGAAHLGARNSAGQGTVHRGAAMRLVRAGTLVRFTDGAYEVVRRREVQLDGPASDREIDVSVYPNQAEGGGIELRVTAPREIVGIDKDTVCVRVLFDRETARSLLVDAVTGVLDSQERAA